MYIQSILILFLDCRELVSHIDACRAHRQRPQHTTHIGTDKHAGTSIWPINCFNGLATFGFISFNLFQVYWTITRRKPRSPVKRYPFRKFGFNIVPPLDLHQNSPPLKPVGFEALKAITGLVHFLLPNEQYADQAATTVTRAKMRPGNSVQLQYLCRIIHGIVHAHSSQTCFAWKSTQTLQAHTCNLQHQQTICNLILLDQINRGIYMANCKLKNICLHIKAPSKSKNTRFNI